MFNELDPLLHSQLRLAVVSLLMAVENAEFTFIKEKTGATAGNLSVQINKLKEAGYVKVEKRFKDNYPQTKCSITERGIVAFEKYVNDLQSYLKPKDQYRVSSNQYRDK
jgi:DNA-binding transcriptional ArsR family regulator